MERTEVEIEIRVTRRTERNESCTSCERTEEDGIIIERRSSGGGGRGPSRRDIEFPQGLPRRYFFLRLNLSFGVPLVVARAERNKKKREKRKVVSSDETHHHHLLAEVRTIMLPLSLLLPSLSSFAAAQTPLLLPFRRFVKRGYPKNLARLSFTRVPFRVGGDRGSFPGSL